MFSLKNLFIFSYAFLIIFGCSDPVGDGSAAQPVSSDAFLRSINLDVGTLNPPFNRQVKNYSVLLPYHTTEINLSVLKAHNQAQLSPSSGSIFLENLAVGAPQVAQFNLTAEDEITQNTYSISIQRKSLFTLILVPGGQFSRDGTENNVSQVSTFRLSNTEVTRAQFQEVMGLENDPSDVLVSPGENDPVQRVNWYQAIAFCNKLSVLENLEPVYTVSGISNWSDLDFLDIPTGSSDATWDAATADWSANGYRLPTEMEWMWAAMGSPVDGQGQDPNLLGHAKAFSGSNGSHNIDDFVWHSGNSAGTAQPVATKFPNELGLFDVNGGLYDMSGNVREWVWDWHASYSGGANANSTGPTTGSTRVVRGGSWNDDSGNQGINTRSGSFPSNQNNFFGFRIARNQ